MVGSVYLCTTRVDQSEKVEARITKFSPHSSPITLVFESKLHPKILRGSPRTGALNEGGVGKIGDFRPLSRRISETVQNRTKVAIDH